MCAGAPFLVFNEALALSEEGLSFLERGIQCHHFILQWKSSAT